jgi:endonuclease-3 related protein
MAIDRDRIRSLHDMLLAHFGPQHWWPGRNAFEVMTGAILVQRTRWEHAAQALSHLDRAGVLIPDRLVTCSVRRLEAMIRPAGFYRQKARRLRGASTWWIEQGGRTGLARQPTARLRQALLALEGIGPETADCILLYVFQRPVFVADAYARRLFRRLGWLDRADSGRYETVAAAVNSAVTERPGFFNELHALIVAHGKAICARTPRCPECPLRRHCPRGKAVKESSARPRSGR